MKIGLFIPCYVDTLYPEVAMVSYKLLKAYGIEVDYPQGQTCCGKPKSNGGFEEKSVQEAVHFDDLFKDYDYVVAPSASCAAFVRINHPRMLQGKRNCESAGKTMDIDEFLHDILHLETVPGYFPHVASIHNSCHGVWELGLSSPSEKHMRSYSKIRNLLSLVKGIRVVETGNHG